MDWTPLIASLPSGGSLAAFIIVVVLFLNDRASYNKQLAETHNLCEQKLEKIADKTLVVIQDNTKAMTSLQEAVRDLKASRI